MSSEIGGLLTAIERLSRWPTADEIRRARLIVAAYAHGHDDLRMLLEALGIASMQHQNLAGDGPEPSATLSR